MNASYVTEPQLTGIWVSNFKCFREPTLVPVGKLTLLFGANGTGKTSFLQIVGLLGMLDQLEGEDGVCDQIALLPGDAEQSLKELRCDPSRKLIVGFRFTAVQIRSSNLASEQSTTDEVDRPQVAPRPITQHSPPFGAKESFDYQVTLELNEAGRWRGDQVHIRMDGHPLADVHLNHGEPDYSVGNEGESRWRLSTESEWQETTQAAVGPLSKLWDSMRLIGVSGPTTPEGEMMRLFQDASNAFRKYSHKLSRVGPIRIIPKAVSLRSRRDTGNDPEWWDRLLEDRNLLKLVNVWMSQPAKFGLGFEFQVTGERDLQLLDLRTGKRTALRDIGSGYSFIFPVVVDALHCPDNFIVQQPELHLHPRMQTVLGDLFLIRMKFFLESTTFVETHSEHLLLRIMKRLRESSVAEGRYGDDQSKISIACFTQDADGAHVERIELAPDGTLMDPWPGGFFDEDLKEFL